MYQVHEVPENVEYILDFQHWKFYKLFCWCNNPENAHWKHSRSCIHIVWNIWYIGLWQDHYSAKERLQTVRNKLTRYPTLQPVSNFLPTYYLPPAAPIPSLASLSGEVRFSCRKCETEELGAAANRRPVPLAGTAVDRRDFEVSGRVPRDNPPPHRAAVQTLSLFTDTFAQKHSFGCRHLGARCI